MRTLTNPQQTCRGKVWTWSLNKTKLMTFWAHLRSVSCHTSVTPAQTAPEQPAPPPAPPNSHLSLQAITCLSFVTGARSSECLSPTSRWRRGGSGTRWGGGFKRVGEVGRWTLAMLNVSIRGSEEHGGSWSPFLLCSSGPLITAGR